VAGKLLGEKGFNVVTVFTAPKDLRNAIQARLGNSAVVLPFDGDVEALIAAMAQKYPKQAYRFVVDGAVSVPDIKNSPYDAQVIRINSDQNPYGWAQALIEFYLGSLKGDLGVLMNFQKVGWNLMVARLAARQA
jgi:hypothetical protein